MVNIDSLQLRVPRHLRRGRLRADEEKSVISAFGLLDLLNSIVPIRDKKILDFGCGVKVTQVLLERGSPQQLYVGLDIYREMIEYLKENVDDPKYHFDSVDFHSVMYNPTGQRMTPQTRLPIPDQTFDILTMFSVVTHQTPEDAAAIFSILKRYADDRSTLIFSAFVDPEQKKKWVDKRKDKPLLRAFFNKAYLEEIVTQSGWRIESYNPPVPGILQHYYVCKLSS